MTPSAAYRQVIAQSPEQYPIFHQPWWLDIACDGSHRWQGLVTHQLHKGIPAIMPLPLLPMKRILPAIRKPLLTPYGRSGGQVSHKSLPKSSSI
ncbi:MAG: hypothetical protein R2795_20140 [Saprospiraceae bacterium]